MSAQERCWRSEESVAWVEGADRVCLLDLRRLTAADLLICPEPAASLWRAVADGPAGESTLIRLASDLVGEDAEALVSAFVSALSTHELLEEVA